MRKLRYPKLSTLLTLLDCITKILCILKKNSHLNVEGVVVQFAQFRCVCKFAFLLLSGEAQHAVVSHWAGSGGSHWVWCCTRASHWAPVHHWWIPLGALSWCRSWCCHRHHSAIAVAPLQLGTDRPSPNYVFWNKTFARTFDTFVGTKRVSPLHLIDRNLARF